ncbi:MAG: hypothetical protein IKX48_16340 [Victivallales bacterium]|nr:hypothetical protein [Victivallales bacterium]
MTTPDPTRNNLDPLVIGEVQKIPVGNADNKISRLVVLEDNGPSIPVRATGDH